MHAILGRLEGHELITQTAQPERSRGVLGQLADTGVAEVEQVCPIIERELIDAFAGRFGPAELPAIADLMERN